MVFFGIKIGLDTTDVNVGVRRVESAMSGMASNIGSSIKNSLAGFLTVGFISEGIKSAVQYASQLNDQTARLGVGTEFFQEWAFAAKQTGASIDDVSSFLEKLSVARTNALQGNPNELKAFEQFKVTLLDLKSLSLEELGGKIANAFSSGNPQTLIASLRELGGRNAGALVPAFTEGMSEAAAEARRLGLIINDDVISSLDNMGDRMEIQKSRMTSAFATIAKVALGAFEKMQDVAEKYFQSAIQFGRSLGETDGTNLTPAQRIARAASASYTGIKETGKMQDEEMAAQIKLLQDRRKRRSIPPDFTSIKRKEEEAKGITPGITPINQDSLSRIGGLYFGSDVNTQIVTSLQEHTRRLLAIENNTAKTSDNTMELKR